MTKKTRRQGSKNARSGKAWAEAKRACRLSQRQVAMAKRLGMNPKKLPGLRPSPSQRWKMPVGQFIEQLYRKRFGPDVRQEYPDRRGNSTGDVNEATDQIESLVDLDSFLDPRLDGPPEDEWVDDLDEPF